MTLLLQLADECLQLLRQRQIDAFDDWLLKAANCTLRPLQTFAKGLFDDYAAVKVSPMTEFSNGPVEGLNNQLKMLKRQMYDRADLEPLPTMEPVRPVAPVTKMFEDIKLSCSDSFQWLENDAGDDISFG